MSLLHTSPISARKPPATKYFHRVVDSQMPSIICQKLLSPEMNPVPPLPDNPKKTKLCRCSKCTTRSIPGVWHIPCTYNRHRKYRTTDEEKAHAEHLRRFCRSDTMASPHEHRHLTRSQQVRILYHIYFSKLINGKAAVLQCIGIAQIHYNVLQFLNLLWTC